MLGRADCGVESFQVLFPEISYTVYDVVGWRSNRGQPVLRIVQDIPDRYWYGEKPRVLKEYKGPGVDELISAVEKAVYAYPWKKTYKAFPETNSNTFIAWIAKQVPELDLQLPLSAIGKGYVEREATRQNGYVR